MISTNNYRVVLLDVCCDVSTLEQTMARVGNEWHINHVVAPICYAAILKSTAISLFCYRRTTSGAPNSLSGLRVAAVGGSCTRSLNLMSGAIILATSTRSVLGCSLCTVEFVPAALVVQMRRLGGNPIRNRRNATSTTVSTVCCMVLRSKKPPKVAVMCIVWIISRNGRASIGTGANPA